MQDSGMVELARTIAGWALICADERVSRVVLYRSRTFPFGGEVPAGEPDNVTVTMWVRARYMPVPHGFVFHGTLAEVVDMAAGELERWPALEPATIGV